MLFNICVITMGIVLLILLIIGFVNLYQIFVIDTSWWVALIKTILIYGFILFALFSLVYIGIKN